MLRLTRARTIKSIFNAAFEFVAGNLKSDHGIVRILADFTASPIQDALATVTAKVVEKASTTATEGRFVVISPAAHPDGVAYPIGIAIVGYFAAVLRTLRDVDGFDSLDIGGGRSCKRRCDGAAEKGEAKSLKSDFDHDGEKRLS